MESLAGLPLVSPVFLQSAPAESYEKSGRVKGVDVHPYRPWVLSVDEGEAQGAQAGTVSVYSVSFARRSPNDAAGVTHGDAGVGVESACGRGEVLLHVNVASVLRARRAARRQRLSQLASVVSDVSEGLELVAEGLRGTASAAEPRILSDDAVEGRASSADAASRLSRHEARSRVVLSERVGRGLGSVMQVRVGVQGLATSGGPSGGVGGPAAQETEEEGWGVASAESLGAVLGAGFWSGSSGWQNSSVSWGGVNGGQGAELAHVPESVWVLYGSVLALWDVQLDDGVLIPLSHIPQPPATPPSTSGGRGGGAARIPFRPLEPTSCAAIGPGSLALGTSSGATLVLHVPSGGPALVTQVLWLPSDDVATPVTHLTPLWGARGAWDGVAVGLRGGHVMLWARPSQSWILRLGPPRPAAHVHGVSKEQEEEEEEEEEQVAGGGVGGGEIGGGMGDVGEHGSAFARDAAAVMERRVRQISAPTQHGGLRDDLGADAAGALELLAPVTAAGGAAATPSPLARATVAALLPGGALKSLEPVWGAGAALLGVSAVGARGHVVTLRMQDARACLATEDGSGTVEGPLALPGGRRLGGAVRVEGHAALPRGSWLAWGAASADLFVGRSGAKDEAAFLCSVAQAHPSLPDRTQVAAAVADPRLPGVLWVAVQWGVVGVGVGVGREGVQWSHAKVCDPVTRRPHDVAIAWDAGRRGLWLASSAATKPLWVEGFPAPPPPNPAARAPTHELQPLRDALAPGLADVALQAAAAPALWLWVGLAWPALARVRAGTLDLAWKRKRRADAEGDERRGQGEGQGEGEGEEGEAELVGARWAQGLDAEGISIAFSPSFEQQPNAAAAAPAGAGEGDGAAGAAGAQPPPPWVGTVMAVSEPQMVVALGGAGKKKGGGGGGGMSFFSSSKGGAAGKGPGGAAGAGGDDTMTIPPALVFRRVRRPADASAPLAAMPRVKAALSYTPERLYGGGPILGVQLAQASAGSGQRRTFQWFQWPALAALGDEEGGGGGGGKGGGKGGGGGKAADVPLSTVGPSLPPCLWLAWQLRAATLEQAGSPARRRKLWRVALGYADSLHVWEATEAGAGGGGAGGGGGGAAGGAAGGWKAQLRGVGFLEAQAEAVTGREAVALADDGGVLSGAAQLAFGGRGPMATWWSNVGTLAVANYDMQIRALLCGHAGLQRPGGGGSGLGVPLLPVLVSQGGAYAWFHALHATPAWQRVIGVRPTAPAQPLETVPPLWVPCTRGGADDDGLAVDAATGRRVPWPAQAAMVALVAASNGAAMTVAAALGRVRAQADLDPCAFGELARIVSDLLPDVRVALATPRLRPIERIQLLVQWARRMPPDVAGAVGHLVADLALKAVPAQQGILAALVRSPAAATSSQQAGLEDLERNGDFLVPIHFAPDDLDSPSANATAAASSASASASASPPPLPFDADFISGAGGSAPTAEPERDTTFDLDDLPPKPHAVPPAEAHTTAFAPVASKESHHDSAPAAKAMADDGFDADFDTPAAATAPKAKADDAFDADFDAPAAAASAAPKAKADDAFDADFDAPAATSAPKAKADDAFDADFDAPAAAASAAPKAKAEDFDADFGSGATAPSSSEFDPF